MQIRPLIKGLTVTFLSILLLTFLGSIFYLLAPVATSSLARFSYWLLFVSFLLGSVTASRIAESRGLFHGLAICFIVLAILTLLGLLLRLPGVIGGHLLIKAGIALLAGILGSIIGTVLAPGRI